MNSADKKYDTLKKYERPKYSLNDSFPQVKKIWSYHSKANVISTPVLVNNKIIFGNSQGLVEALSEKSGEKLWEYKTQGGIFSSPISYKSYVIFGSGDSYIYCLNSEDGSLLWKYKTKASVLGSPIISGKIVYIGGSDGNFRALDVKTGKQVWVFNGLKGPVVSKPLLYDNKVIFGAWDKNLYALDSKTGSLDWTWNNGSANRMFSPAMVIPVANNDVIYIVAPDRYLTAINAKTGETLWRNNDATVRESIGISNDKKRIYGKTMNDEIVAFKANKEKAEIIWSKNLHFGYDHVPSMLIERNDAIYFGTRNGVIYSMNSKNQNLNWKFKIDNSMVNTVNIFDENKLVAATMDGKIILLTW